MTGPGPELVAAILNAVRELLEVFVVYYLRVNGDACSAAPAGGK